MAQMDIPEQARAAADAGDTIGAIKLVRQATGLGLKDAKAAVDAYLQHGVTVVDGGRRLPNDLMQAAPLARAAADDGQAIEAMKQVRLATGVGLKDAKAAVEAYMTSHGIAAESAPTSWGLPLLFLALVVGIGVVGLLLSANGNG